MSLAPHPAYLVPRLQRCAVLLFCALLACAEPKEPSFARPSAPSPAASTPAALLASDGASAADPDAASARTAERGAPRGEQARVLPISREQLITRLLEPAQASWTIDAVQQRFMELGLQRTEPLPGSLQLVVHSDSEHLQFNYLPDDQGGWRFADSSLEMPTKSAEEVLASYKKLSALLQKRLGKPTWSKDDAQYRSRGYKLGKQLDVALGAVATEGDSRPYLAFSVAVRANTGH